MAKEVFLSIVVPTYNRAHLIIRTLESILKQSEEDFEVIVVDDGSSDNTKNVIAPYLSENVHYIKIPNSERGAARNRGTEIAAGKYINWFDSDDIMLSNHVSTVKRIAQEFNFPEVITTHYSIQDAADEKITSIENNYKKHLQKNRDFLIEGNYLACNPVIVRKDIALENPFIEDRTLSASEDYELWLRLKAKYNFYGTDEITSYLIQHSERSVNQMTDPEKLEKRFLAFLDLTLANEQTKRYIGKNLNYFVMRNYLVLAVDLAYNKHKKIAFKYLRKAILKSGKSVNQRVFWATLKHLIK